MKKEKKKKRRKNKVKLEEIARLVIIMDIMLGLVLIIYGVDMFTTGWHNMDVAQNLEEMEGEMNYILLYYGVNESFNYVETLTDGQLITLDDGYRLGARQIKQGNKLCIVGGVVFGLSLGALITGRKNGVAQVRRK